MGCKEMARSSLQEVRALGSQRPFQVKSDGHENIDPRISICFIVNKLYN
ncbi:hypothetical protein PDE_00296 [Penicillium oxalicum 114-2]|uniref:Uncharacterized protein n=1 Tax=Penicillium oxalicum (strain 114-2 / CGMCC 5302) TaxID=933388 RepID=S8AI42_PENO1|nr:hypothetical protein PDE_00296 [Penicillium oxalicum 114-2]